MALVTAAPGHLNAMSALYGALMAESPVVLLSGHAPLGQVGRGAFQEMDQVGGGAASDEGRVARARCRAPGR